MSNTSGSNFLSLKTSPSNWAMNQAVHLNKEGSRGSARGMMVVSGLFGPISSGKHLACFAVKVPLLPFGIAGLTMKDVSSIKDKSWTKLEVLKQVVINTGRALLELAMHIYKCVMFLTFSPLCCLTVGMISPEAAKKAHDWLKLTYKEPSDQKKPVVEPKPSQQAEPKPNQPVVITPEVPHAQPLPEVVDNNPPEQNNAQPEDQQASPDLGNQSNDSAPTDEKNDNPPKGDVPPPPPPPEGLLSPRKQEPMNVVQTTNTDEKTGKETDKAQSPGVPFSAELVKKAQQMEQDNQSKPLPTNGRSRTSVKIQELKDERTSQAEQEKWKKIDDNSAVKNAQDSGVEGDEEDDDSAWDDEDTSVAAKNNVSQETQPKQSEQTRPLPPIPANPPIAAQPKLADRPLPVPKQTVTPVTPVKTEPKTSEDSLGSPDNNNSPAEGQGKSKRAQQRRKRAAAKAAGNGSPEPKPTVAQNATAKPVSQQPAQVPAQQPENKPVSAAPSQAKVPAQAPAKAPVGVVPKPGSKWAAKVVLAPGSEQVQENLPRAVPKGMGRGTIDMQRAKLINRRTQMYSDETVRGAGVGTDDDDETLVVQKQTKTRTPVTDIFPQQK